jgi:phosphoglycolate phosphatase
LNGELLARRVWLLDLDGTLVDSSDGVVRAFHAAQSAHGEPPADVERIRRAIGYPFAETVATLSLVPFDEFFPHFRREAMATMHLHSRLLPGARELLERLRRSGRVCALVTSKRSDNAGRILAHLGVDSYFATIVGDESVARPKPDPGPVLAALERLGAAPEEALMVGDTQNDIRAARAAGVPVIALAGGVDPPEDLIDADLCLPGAEALAALLRPGEP